MGTTNATAPRRTLRSRGYQPLSLRDSIERRSSNLRTVLASPHLQVVMRLHLANDVVAFVNDWCWTYDPRRVPSDLPFDLFPIQEEYLLWRNERLEGKENGVVEKSRDMGVTWLNAVWHVWRWLFHPGHKGTFGSRKQELVDKLGDPDSIFEKIRFILRRLPKFLLPVGKDHRGRPEPYQEDKHATLLRIVNPENDSVLTGEAGDNMGRGGRSTVYDADEFAFVERDQKVDAALSNNSDVIFYTSTPNGIDNVFYVKRHSGNTAVFTLHWTDHPEKTDEWYAEMVAKIDNEVTVAQELDIDYYASAEGVVIRKAWVDAAVRRELPEPGPWALTIGVDVATFGNDKSAAVIREGKAVLWGERWSGHDPIESGDRVIGMAKDCEPMLAPGDRIFIFVDAIGVGAGTLAYLERERKRLGKEDLWVLIGVQVGERSPELKCFRLRDALWWRMRKWFQDEAPAISSEIPGQTVAALVNDLARVTYDVKEDGIVHITSKRQMRKKGIASPDLADALMQTFYWEAMRPKETDEPGWLQRKKGGGGKGTQPGAKKRGYAA